MQLFSAQKILGTLGTFVAGAAFLTLSLPGLLRAQAPVKAPTNVAAVKPVAATVQGSVHSIEIPRPETVAMPPGPGAEAYNANCLLCHTNRYVLMQPKFARKTWEAEVTKMVNVYGAPIAEGAQKEIVDYLMSVRGKADPAPAARPAPAAGGDAATTKK